MIFDHDPGPSGRWEESPCYDMNGQYLGTRIEDPYGTTTYIGTDGSIVGQGYIDRSGCESVLRTDGNPAGFGMRNSIGGMDFVSSDGSLGWSPAGIGGYDQSFGDQAPDAPFDSFSDDF